MLTLSVKVPLEAEGTFFKWQATLNRQIAEAPGFVSLETSSDNGAWTIVERFQRPQDLKIWRSSSTHQKQMGELYKFIEEKSIQETVQESSKNNVTEVFVTEVRPGREEAFRAWSAKIHQAETRFQGFRGTYFQSPHAAHGKNWITLIHFDTPEHLDLWLSSDERQKLLEEAKSLMMSFEDHRVISPYSGWFRGLDAATAPPGWKQALLVLLVLYPLVMLEILFLNPHLQFLNTPLQTFIGNVISVSLVTFPMMPIAIYFFKGWLVENSSGLFAILGLLLAEILFFLLIQKLLF